MQLCTVQTAFYISFFSYIIPIYEYIIYIFVHTHVSFFVLWVGTYNIYIVVVVRCSLTPPPPPGNPFDRNPTEQTLKPPSLTETVWNLAQRLLVQFTILYRDLCRRKSFQIHTRTHTHDHCTMRQTAARGQTCLTVYYCSILL